MLRELRRSDDLENIWRIMLRKWYISIHEANLWVIGDRVFLYIPLHSDFHVMDAETNPAENWCCYVCSWHDDFWCFTCICMYVCMYIYVYISILFTVFYIFSTGFFPFPFSARQKCSGKVFKIIYYNFSTLSPLSLGVCVFAGLGASAGSSQFQYICCVCVRDCSCIMYILLEIYIFTLNCLRLSFWILLRKIDKMKTKGMKWEVI